MKQTLILAAVMLATAGLAWAEAPTAAPAEMALPAATADLAPGPLFADGSCEMPDLAGLSEEEIAAAAFAAGLDTSPTAAAAAPPACPVAFQCNSITNCAAGPLCSVTDIGQCCTQGPFTLCCISGTIKVSRCPCRCTAFACSLQCVSSTNVKWGCS